jgi:hypothetical protein
MPALLHHLPTLSVGYLFLFQQLKCVAGWLWRFLQAEKTEKSNSDLLLKAAAKKV